MLNVCGSAGYRSLLCSFSLGLISAMSTHILHSSIASQVSSQQPYVLYDHSTASIQKKIYVLCSQPCSATIIIPSAPGVIADKLVHIR